MWRQSKSWSEIASWGQEDTEPAPLLAGRPWYPVVPCAIAAAGTRQERVRAATRTMVAAYEKACRDTGQLDEDTYIVDRIEGHDITATLVNVVYMSTARQVARMAPNQQQQVAPAINAASLPALMRSLLGIASFGVKPNGNIELSFNVRPPFRAKHTFTSGNMRLQETAATSDAIGRTVLDATLALIAQGLGPDARLEAYGRVRTNEVYTAYLPFHLDMRLVRELVPKPSDPLPEFVGIILSHPAMGKKKLLVFPKGIIICVGNKHYSEMIKAIRRFLPDLAHAALKDGSTSTAAAPRRRGRSLAKKRTFSAMSH